MYHSSMKNENTKKRASPALFWLLVVTMCASIIFVITFAVVTIAGSFYMPKNSADFFVGSSANAHSKISAFRQTEKSDGNNFKNYCYFEFSDSQINAINQFSATEKNLSLEVAIKKNKAFAVASEDDVFAFGFLYDMDFLKKGKLRSELPARPLVTADFKKLEEKNSASENREFVFSFAFENSPKGFFIYASQPAELISVAVKETVVGWFSDEEKSFYGFSSNGGEASKNYDIDFSAILNSKLHDAVATLYFDDTYSSVSSSKNIVSVAMGRNNLQIRRANNLRNINLPSVAFSDKVSNISVTGNEAAVSGITVRAAADESAPYKVDPGLILKWKKDSWRQADYEIFEWDRFPCVFIFDFADYDVQNDYLRRLAFFVEKAGFRGKLLSDLELSGRHAFNAHDYSAESLAFFFEKARAENFPLNERERHLKDVLIKNGVIVQKDGGAISAGYGAIISISQESTPELRTQLLAHEGWHGIFFTDEEFRRKSQEFLNLTDKGSVGFLVKYFVTTPGLSYDMTNAMLMVNEFMAYMLERPVPNIATYFSGNLANRATVQSRIPAEADYVRQTKGTGFTEAAQKFDRYVYERWGLNGGRVWLVTN